MIFPKIGIHRCGARGYCRRRAEACADHSISRTRPRCRSHSRAMDEREPGVRAISAGRARKHAPAAAADGAMTASWPACAAITVAALLTLPAGRAEADPWPLPSGWYEITSRLELPHLERWAIDRTARVCLSSPDTSGAIPVPVLSANTPFETCTATNVTAGGGTLAYDIVCPGRDAARAHAVYALAPDKFAGRVAMVMGAKNMTMTEVQHARRIGDCAPAVRSSATRY